MINKTAFETLLSTIYVNETTATYGNDLYRILMNTTPEEWEHITGSEKHTS